MTKKKLQRLATVADNIQAGDLLLFRGRGWLSIIIGKAGRSKYSHAAKVDIWDGQHFCCEVRELKGGRIVTLESQVVKFPGQIDVFRANALGFKCFDKAASAKYMRQFAGRDYGYWSVAKAALQHLPFLRIYFQHDYEQENHPSTPPFCSAACSAADRIGGGFDPVPGLADCSTVPGDLAHSAFYQYYCTLTGA